MNIRYGIIILALVLSACDKKITVNTPTGVPLNVSCDGNLFDGTLPLENVDVNVELDGAMSPDAKFVLNVNSHKCVIDQCDDDYDVANSGFACIPKSCTLLNSGLDHATSVSGDLINGCIADACSANYEVNAGVCAAISCTVANANIPFAASVTGNVVTGCQVATCMNGYEVDNNQCSPISCTTANAGIAHATVVSGDLVMGCSVTSCEGNYLVNNNQCDPVVCTTANAGINHATSVSGDLVTGCTVNTCDVNYAVNNNQCEPINCTTANAGITHATSVSGDLVNGCSVNSCDANYYVNNNQCDPVLCTTVNAGITHATSVSGDLINGCTVNSCDTNYQVNNNMCEPISCTVGNSGIAFAASVSGDLVNGCTVDSCDANYEVDNNQCLPIACTTVNAGIAFATSVSGDLVNGCTVNTCETNYQVENNQCTPVTCTISNAGIDHAATVNGDLVNGCTVTTCDANYQVNNNLCEPISCTVANSGIAFATSVSGDLVNGCTVTSCDTNYQINNNQCEPINCTTVNAGIDHATSVSGDLVGGCTVDSCETNYEINNNMCEPIVCTPANSGIAFATSVSGDLVTGCTVNSCEINYEVDNNQCSPILCTTTNAGIDHATMVSGDLVGGCFVDACETDYQINNNMCEPISCTVANSGIAFATSVTGDLVSGCLVTSCEPNYEVNNNQCSPISCTTANAGIDHATSVSGDLVGGCTVNTCETNYEVNNNLCEPISCTTANSGINHATSVSGDLVNGCLVDACETNYEINNNMCEPISCTVANAGIDFAAIVSGDLVVGCQVETCEPNYQVNNNMCEPVTCTVANSGIDHATSVSGDLVNGCLVDTCETNYEVSANQCQPIACTTANSGIDNVDQVYGDLVNGCYVLTCQLEYEESNNMCVGVSCDLSNAQGNGVDNIFEVATVSGTINDDSCLVDTCNDYYSPSGNLKSCLPKNCNELTSTELSSLGYDLTNAEISGIYPACSVTCLSVYQQLAGDGKSCEDLDPSGSFAFTQDYTNTFSGNQIDILSTNAQQLALYRNSDCSNLVTTISLPLSSALVDLPSSGDGTKIMYGQFVNNTKVSSCSSDSIIYDTGVPTVDITSPADLSNLTSNFFTVSGTCSEDTSVSSFLVNVEGTDFNATCSGGLFNTAVNVVNVADGDVHITATLVDSAQNSATDSITLNKETSGLIDGNFNGLIRAAYRQRDGKLLVAGEFTSFTDSNNVSYYTGKIARLNINGTLDQEFTDNVGNTASFSGFNGNVYALAVDTNDNIYVGGTFSSFKGVNNNANSVAKLKPTGEFDQTFSNNLDVTSGVKASTSGFDANVFALAVDSQNNLYVGGLITSFKGIANNARGIAKLSSSGIFNQTFSDNLDVTPGVKATTSGLTRSTAVGTVYAIVVDTNDNIYLGGFFENYKGVANNANKIAKIDTNGILNQTFSDNLDVTSGVKASTSGFRTGAAVSVNSLAIDSQNNIYVAGRFVSFKSTNNNANKIAKLNSNGVFDQTFSDNLDITPGVKATTSGFGSSSSIQLYSIVLDKNNDLIVGGAMDTFKGVANNARGIAKLSTSGVFSQSFSDNLDVIPGVKDTTSGFDITSSNGNFIYSIIIDSSNNIYNGGKFTLFKNQSAPYYLKLLNSGLLPN